ncbi:MAG: DUF4845 domain-containing protein [Thiotrichaceae bacterium]
MNIRKRQYGGGMVVAIVVIAISLWLSFKLVPIYLQNGTVSTILDGIRQETDVAKKSNADLQQLLLSRLGFEKIDRINQNNFADLVKIERNVEGFSMTVQYDTRSPLVANISLVVDYKKTIKVP